MPGQLSNRIPTRRGQVSDPDPLLPQAPQVSSRGPPLSASPLRPQRWLRAQSSCPLTLNTPWVASWSSLLRLHFPCSQSRFWAQGEAGTPTPPPGCRRTHLPHTRPSRSLLWKLIKLGVGQVLLWFIDQFLSLQRDFPKEGTDNGGKALCSSRQNGGGNREEGRIFSLAPV